MEKLLIVEDVQAVRNQLKSGLGKEYVVLEGTDRGEAMELFLRHVPKVVALDLGLPAAGASAKTAGGRSIGASDGFRCLEWMIESRPGTKVVVLTGTGEREMAYRAVGSGAYDFYQKPIQLAELKIIIRRAFHLSRMEDQRSRLQEALERSCAGIEGIMGQCAAMQELFSDLHRMTLEVQELEAEGAGIGEPPGRARVELSFGAARLEQKGAGQEQEGEMAALPTEHLTLREVRDRVEKGMVTAAVGNCGGNMVRASELLGVSRPALYDLMKKHGLFKPGIRH